MTTPLVPDDIEVLRTLREHGSVSWSSSVLPFAEIGMTGQDTKPPAPELATGIAFSLVTNGRPDGVAVRFVAVRENGTRSDIFRKCHLMVAAKFISALCDMIRTGGTSRLHLTDKRFLHGYDADSHYLFTAVRSAGQLVVMPKGGEEVPGTVGWMSMNDTGYVRLCFCLKSDTSILSCSNVEGRIGEHQEAIRWLLDTLSSMMRLVEVARVARGELDE